MIFFGLEGAFTVATTGDALGVSGFPSPAAAGPTRTFMVTASNTSGRVATGYLGTVHFTSSDPQATLPADYRFTLNDAGEHTFSATLNTAGTQSITTTDTATPDITGTQSGVTVYPASAAFYFNVSGFPLPVTAGQAGTITVTARDTSDHVATGYVGTVTFTSSDPQAALPPDYTFAAADAGRHTFSAVLDTAGYQSITATDTATPTITGSATDITINPAAASQLAVSGYPSPADPFTGGYVLVQALDPYGNVAEDYTGTVHLTTDDPQADVDPDYTFTAADGGQYYFGVQLYTAGTHAITATDTADPSITGTQSDIVVNPAEAATLAITGPSAVTAGQADTWTVTAYDSFGNVAAGYTGTVTFTSSDPQAALPPDYTFTEADAGIQTFSVTFETVDTQSLTVTDTATPDITGTQSGIVVNPPGPGAAAGSGGAPSVLTVSAADASARADGSSSPREAGAGNPSAATAVSPGYTATGYTGTSPLGSGGQAVRHADALFGAADGGWDGFSAVLNTPAGPWVDTLGAVIAGVRGRHDGLAADLSA
jgi:hypothetical protein